MRTLTFMTILLLSFSAPAVCGPSRPQDNPTVQEKKSESVLKEIFFKKETGTIRYTLMAPVRVRIRVGVNDGPLYRTLVDWEERGVGEHEEKWDGMDASGNFPLLGRHDLAFTFNYFTDSDEYLPEAETFNFQPPADSNIGRHLPNLTINRIHKGHDRSLCYEPKLKLVVAPGTEKTEKDFYVIKEKTSIKIELNDKDKRWFDPERYSLHIFIDDVFVRGELDSYSPYTWTFDPKGLNEGEHLIMVNLAGFSDHYAMAGLPVYVKKE